MLGDFNGEIVLKVLVEGGVVCRRIVKVVYGERKREWL
jgi:hypothetical protein